MAIVKLKSNLFPASPLLAVDPAVARGRTITATFSIDNAAGDSSGSTYKLCDIPADCLFDEATIFKVDGWGFAQVTIGTKDDIDAFVTVARAAGTYVQPVTVGGARHGLEAWVALGMAAKPASNVIGIYAHAEAGATGAGVLKGKLVYRYH